MEDVTGEHWAPVHGYEGIYEVSDHGRVRSVQRVSVDRLGRSSRLRGQVLRTRPNRNGYPVVRISSGNRNITTLAVHRMVLTAFVGPCPDGMECLHRNGIRDDPRLENLHWGTRSENRYDSVRHGTNAMTAKTHCPQGHPLWGANLHPPLWKREQRRACRSCKKARERLRYWPRTGDMPAVQQLADQLFAEIAHLMTDEPDAA